MAKLRKMLCDIQSSECVNLMRLIETQSQATLSAWAVSYAKQRYLPVYWETGQEDPRLLAATAGCEEYLQGEKKLAEIKPALKAAAQLARELEGQPIAQAAARAVAVACATVQTPTNALGYLFYGAAAVAYQEAGLTQPPEVYDELALREFQRAYASLQEVMIPDEPRPAKIQWNC